LALFKRLHLLKLHAEEAVEKEKAVNYEQGVELR